jgi:phosphatidylserine/phosphatidylglycerophosphate/cardiolipin synthase-like enzyme
VSGELGLRFLLQGGQAVEDVAAELAGFLTTATRDVAVAIYDFHLAGGGDAVAETLQGLAARGVRVRICDHDDRITEYKSVVPVPAKPPEYVDSLGLDVRPVTDYYGLMHHKYAVVDGVRVWTGSLNWTTDAFTLQENCVVTAESAELAAAFLRNFEELWESRVVEGSGEYDPPPTELALGGDPVEARPLFCPGRGGDVAGRIASAIRRARHRVVVCSPVLTSGPILGALGDVLERPGLAIGGAIDGTQMRGVLRQWAQDARGSWKPEAFRAIAERAGFAAKVSIPWAPGRPHDYMHAKILVADDRAFVGSYNHSRSGEENAENVLALTGAAAADRLVAYVDEVGARYPVWQEGD